MVTLAFPLMVVQGIPVDPDAPHARQWLIDELAKPEYQAAKPSWFDMIAQAIRDWLASLRMPEASGTGTVFVIVAVVIIIGVIVVAFLVFGAPRRSRRARIRTVFDENDTRTSAELRTSSVAAAAAGHWSDAVLDRFRAITLALRERTVVSITPGTTAHEVAERAAPVFPRQAAAVREAASVFDAVRYLGRAGTHEDYERLRTLDDALGHEHPVLSDLEPTVALAGPR